MGQIGYVYAMINPSIPDLVKVGHTTRDPKSRASELSSATGVATPFIVVYSEMFLDSEEAEEFVHEFLKQKGHRLSESREFFSAEISEVIKAISIAPGKIDPDSNVHEKERDELIDYDDEFLPEFKIKEEEEKSPAEELFDEGWKHLHGSGDYIKDPGEAYKLFIQAAKLGSTEALIAIGHMYAQGDHVSKSLPKALDYFKQACKKGNYNGYFSIGQMFRYYGDSDNSDKAYKMFFSEIASKGIKGNELRAMTFIEMYLSSHVLEGVPGTLPEYARSVICMYKDKLVESISNDIEIDSDIAWTDGLDEEIRQSILSDRMERLEEHEKKLEFLISLS